MTDSLTKPRPINGYSCKQLPVFRKIKCRFCQAYEITSARLVFGVLLTNIIILISFLNIQTQGHAFRPFCRDPILYNNFKIWTFQMHKIFSIYHALWVLNILLRYKYFSFGSQNTFVLRTNCFNVMENFQRFFLNFKIYYYT